MQAARVAMETMNAPFLDAPLPKFSKELSEKTKKEAENNELKQFDQVNKMIGLSKKLTAQQAIEAKEEVWLLYAVGCVCVYVCICACKLPGIEVDSAASK